jgi:hypothetical protein
VVAVWWSATMKPIDGPGPLCHEEENVRRSEPKRGI